MNKKRMKSIIIMVLMLLSIIPSIVVGDEYGYEVEINVEDPPDGIIIEYIEGAEPGDNDTLPESGGKASILIIRRTDHFKDLRFWLYGTTIMEWTWFDGYSHESNVTGYIETWHDDENQTYHIINFSTHATWWGYHPFLILGDGFGIRLIDPENNSFKAMHVYAERIVDDHPVEIHDKYFTQHPFSLGCSKIGNSNQIVHDRIAGSVFTADEYGTANNITAYINQDFMSPGPYKCMIYRKNDSKLIGTTTEDWEPLPQGDPISSSWWAVFNFTEPKPVLEKDTAYILTCWGDNEYNRFYYDVISQSNGRYDTEIYGTSPNPASFTNENKVYSIYCSYTPDTTAPQITNITLNHSSPKDTNSSFGWENITCNITDNIGVNEVKLNITYNGTTISEYSMIQISDTDIYYYNTTFIDDGCYQYYIWAEDLSGNNATSSSSNFELPPNHDVDEDGETGFWDMTAISLMYGETGPLGWVREDIDNDGYVGFWDLTTVSLYYGEYWYTCGGEGYSSRGFGGNATVSIQPAEQTIDKGETFTVSVYIEPDEAIIGAAFDYLYFDADLIHVNSVTEGDLFNNILIFNDGDIDNENGVITDVYLITRKAKDKSGSLINIEFTAQQELGMSDLNLEGIIVANENNKQLRLEINDGTAIIQ